MMVYKAKMPEAWTSLQWCREQFGSQDLLEDGYPMRQYSGHNITHGLRWWRRQGHVFFCNEQDYLLYLLRWA